MPKVETLQSSDQIVFADGIVQVQDIAELTRGDILVMFVEYVKDEDGKMVDEAIFPKGTEIEVVGG